MGALTTLIEHSSDVISFLSPAGRILYTSASSGRLFGYHPEEIVGRNALDLIYPEDRRHSRRALADVLAGPPGPRRLDVRLRRKDGGWCWVESTVSHLPDETTRFGPIIVNCRPIRDEVRPRENTRKQTDELVRSNGRLEDFAYAVAHDLREPLRTISMFTELLLKDLLLDDERQQKARFIVDGVARMSVLLEGLHAFAFRGFEAPSRPLDLNRIVADVVKNLGHSIETCGAKVIVDLLPTVQGREQHLVRVFQNLIANAIKYRSEAPVEIRVTAEELRADWIIKVRDNGVGIATEHQDGVFGLFKRLHGSETAGAGVGLALCRKIVEAMGGAIWVESEPGSGSTFCFTLPVVAEAPLRQPKGSHGRVRVNGGGACAGHDPRNHAAPGSQLS